MENEVREVTYLAVSLLIVSLVLGFISYGIKVTHKFAEARNQEIAATEKIEQFREYSGYNQKTLIGDEVIELIRQKYDSGVTIFVDYRKNPSLGTEVKTKVTCSSCSAKDGDHRIYSVEMYTAHVNASVSNNYFLVNTNASGENKNDLRNWYPTDSLYRAYLVYNSVDPRDYYTSLMQTYNSIVSSYTGGKTGEALKQAKCDALDAAAGSNSIDSEVTGIVLVSYKTLGIT